MWSVAKVFSGPMGIRPVYLTANVGYDYPAAPSGSACIQFDAHVSYPRLHNVIEQAAATRGTSLASSSFHFMLHSSHPQHVYVMPRDPLEPAC